ncbi:MAG: hypothetical protein FD131_5063 [Rhodocyclaceae bacterium]|nr:MAG: hypothetical protein FD131_5063 [Rhodocyclaceae bacterium]
MPGHLAGNDCRRDAAAEAPAGKGRPAATAENRVVRRGETAVADQHQVGPVALAQVAAFGNLKQVGDAVAGFGDQGRQVDDAVVHQAHQAGQRVLGERQAGRRLEVAAGFFCQGVRRVVGADDVDPVAVQRGAQGVAVGLGFDRRIAFEMAAQSRVIAVVEQQMMDADLGGDALVGQRLPCFFASSTACEEDL